MQNINPKIREDVAQIEDEIRKEASEGHDGARLNRLYGQLMNQAFIMQSDQWGQFIN